MKDIKLEWMTIETRKRHPIYIDDWKKYYIEVNMWPFTLEEYDIKINQLKKLAEENSILAIPEYTWYCKVYWCEHECWYVNNEWWTISYCPQCGKLTKYE